MKITIKILFAILFIFVTGCLTKRKGGSGTISGEVLLTHIIYEYLTSEIFIYPPCTEVKVDTTVELIYNSQCCMPWLEAISFAKVNNITYSIGYSQRLNIINSCNCRTNIIRMVCTNDTNAISKEGVYVGMKLSEVLHITKNKTNHDNCDYYIKLEDENWWAMLEKKDNDTVVNYFMNVADITTKANYFEYFSYKE